MDWANCSGLKIASGLGVTTLANEASIAGGMNGVDVDVGVSEMAGVFVIEGVSVMEGVREIVGVLVMVGVRLGVVDGGKY